MQSSCQTSHKTSQTSKQTYKSIQKDSYNQKDDNTKWAFIYESLKENQQFEDFLVQDAKDILKRNEIDFGMGAMFGAFIGDALGSYCEFRIDAIKQEDPQLDLIMQMPGKGTWNIKPGQFTDDSELASHLLQVLSSTYNPKKTFDSQQDKILMKIAQQYVTWFKSDPFDIGHTTRKAFKILRSNLYELKIDRQDKESEGVPSEEIEKEQHKILHKTLQEIRWENKNSHSNGSLMRITPMAFFISLLLQRKELSQLNTAHFEQIIKSEVSMTHGNQEILQSSFAWVELLVELILRKKDKKTLKQIYDNFIEKYKNESLIKEWIADSISEKQLDAVEEQGRARLAFAYGIKALKSLSEVEDEELSEENYKSLIRNVVKRVGDSDTNACIVGGLIGAVLGFKKLPVKYLQKKFSLELNEDDKECSFRGKFYEPRRQFYKAIKLVEKFSSQ